jgi:hypothetical protein
MAGHEEPAHDIGVAMSTSDEELAEGRIATYSLPTEGPDMWLFNPMSDVAACPMAGPYAADSSSGAEQQEHSLQAMEVAAVHKLNTQQMPEDWTAGRQQAIAVTKPAEQQARTAAEEHPGLDACERTLAVPENHSPEGCAGQPPTAAAPYQHAQLTQQMKQLSSKLQELRDANAAAAAAAGNLNLLVSTFLIKAAAVVQAGPKVSERHLKAQADLQQMLHRKAEHWTLQELRAVRDRFPCLSDKSSSGFIACNKGARNHRSKAGIRRELIAGLTREVLEVSQRTVLIVPPDLWLCSTLSGSANTECLLRVREMLTPRMCTYVKGAIN